MTLLPSKFSARGFYATIAILFGIHLFAGVSARKFEISDDGLEYVRMAENMLAGSGFSFDGSNPVIGKTPGMPALIALHLTVFGSMKGFQVLQLSLLFVGYLAAMALASKLEGQLAALGVLAGLVALDPIRRLAAGPLSEPLYIALFAWGLYLAVGSLEGGQWRRAAVAGVLFGLATYVRPVSLFWSLFLLLIILAFTRLHLRTAVVITIAQLLTVAPWIVRGYMTFGKVVPMASNWGPAANMTEDLLWDRFTVSGHRDLHANPPYTQAMAAGFLFNEAPQDTLKKAAILGWKKDPGGCLIRCIKQSAFAWTYCPGTKEWKWRYPVGFWLGRLAMLGFLVLSGVGLTSLWSHERTMSIVLGGQALYAAIVLFPVSTESRYLVPVYICLVPAVAVAMSTLIRKQRDLSVNPPLS